MRIVMTGILLLKFALLTYAHDSNVKPSSFIDTSTALRAEAVRWLQGYYAAFAKGESPDYKQFFSGLQCVQYPVADPMAYGVASDATIYQMCTAGEIFFLKSYPDHIHAKVMFTWKDSASISTYAITNHYIYQDAGIFYFKTEQEQHPELYQTDVNGNIVYIHPKNVAFDLSQSDSLLHRLARFEREWGFEPLKQVRYIYANDNEQLSRMKGFDFVFNCDENTPSGYADVESNTVYCQGMGANYLHELLHLYLNKRYPKSVMCHGLIYYMAGGLGGSFQGMVQRLKAYLKQYPETNLTAYEDVISKDRMLHIDHAVNAMICDMVYHKEGVKGLKRLLQYTSLDTLYEKEFKVKRAKLDAWLRKQLVGV